MRRPRIVLAALAAAVTLLAGCANTVDGTGSLASGAASHGQDFTGQPSQPGPSGSPGTTAVPTPPPSGPGGSQAGGVVGCPHVVYPRAKLRFDCVTTGMQPGTSPVWPLIFQRSVEQSTGWVLEEGAGHWGDPQGSSLAAIATNVRQQMLDGKGYGDSPQVTTVADKDVTINGAKAHLLQSMMTINPAWAQQNHTKVKQEQLWIVALQVGSADVSLWYTSIPDLAKDLWPQVPSVMNTIHVG